MSGIQKFGGGSSGLPMFVVSATGQQNSGLGSIPNSGTHWEWDLTLGSAYNGLNVTNSGGLIYLPSGVYLIAGRVKFGYGTTSVAIPVQVGIAAGFNYTWPGTDDYVAQYRPDPWTGFNNSGQPPTPTRTLSEVIVNGGGYTWVGFDLGATSAKGSVAFIKLN